MPIAKVKIAATKSALPRVRKAKAVTSTAQLPAVEASVCTARLAAVATPQTATPIALPTSPRPDSKLGIVVGLLQRPDGASLTQLIAVTGWLPHTMRAALTGLRKRGFVVSSAKAAGEKASTYQITSSAV